MTKADSLTAPVEGDETLSSMIEAEILEKTTQRRRDSFNRLKAACDALVKKRRELKLADVAREISTQFGEDVGPTSQSIANDKEGFRRYVEARERERVAELPPLDRKAIKGPESIRQLLAKIEDVDTRSRVIELHDRCVASEKALARAKFLLAEGGLIHNDEKVPNAQDVDGNRVLDELAKVLLDSDHLDRVGLIRDETGRVRRKTGTRDELLSPSVMNQIIEAAKKRMKS